jgi:hypothetical protein
MEGSWEGRGGEPGLRAPEPTSSIRRRPFD